MDSLEFIICYVVTDRPSKNSRLIFKASNYCRPQQIPRCANYYRKCVPNAAKIQTPLIETRIVPQVNITPLWKQEVQTPQKMLTLVHVDEKLVSRSKLSHNTTKPNSTTVTNNHVFTKNKTVPLPKTLIFSCIH